MKKPLKQEKAIIHGIAGRTRTSLTRTSLKRLSLYNSAPFTDMESNTYHPLVTTSGTHNSPEHPVPVFAKVAWCNRSFDSFACEFRHFVTPPGLRTNAFGRMVEALVRIEITKVELRVTYVFNRTHLM